MEIILTGFKIFNLGMPWFIFTFYQLTPVLALFWKIMTNTFFFTISICVCVFEKDYILFYHHLFEFGLCWMKYEAYCFLCMGFITHMHFEKTTSQIKY